MLLQRSHRLWAVVPLVALLAAGCVSTVPTVTNGPSASVPNDFPSGLPTIPPTDIPLVTASPAPGTTLPPTDAPTENPHPNWPPGAIGAGKANEHVGEQATVCGTVDTVRWLFSEPGHPTWINFNRPYPNMKFNGLIWGEERKAWSLNGKPEVVYPGKEICVSGVIEAYSTWVQMQNLTKADFFVVP